MKLLIAEDDKTSRLILRSVCTKWGYDVVAVEDGQAAWELMQGIDVPQLMIIDWEMPRMNGVELCQHIRKKFPDNPPYMILLTSRNETQDIVVGLKEGANDYIAKPFNNDELQVRISVGRRVLQLQNELHETNVTLSIERSIIENIILAMNARAPFDNTSLRSIQAPVEKNSGDILFAAHCPDGTQHLLLGDFTGHGITAALGGPIAADAFYEMTAKGLPLVEIGNEINRHMCSKMPIGLFLAAILLEVNPQRNSIRIWNCGMEDILFFRKDNFRECIKSNRPALGIIKENLDNMVVLAIQASDKLYAYSDGKRLIASIVKMLEYDKDIEAIQSDTDQFKCGTDQLDDLTLVELSI